MISEPHKIKTIRKVVFTTLKDRTVFLKNANFNTFNINSKNVTFDMTSQGTSAMSQNQLSGLFIGDETYAGSRNFEFLLKTVKDIFGFEYVCPTHNLKGSHKLITSTMLSKDDVIYSNSKLIELFSEDKSASVELLIENENDPNFSGNINTSELENKLSGKTNVPYVYIELYKSGYKAVSLSNIEEVHKICVAKKVPLIVNFSRIVENANYIRENSTEYKNLKLAEIIKKISAFTDVCVLDAAQDPRCNTGGLIATGIYDLYEKYMNEVVVFEGLHTYGGMAGRTMEVFSRGINEMIYENQAKWISQQIKDFASLLKGIPYHLGSDGIYIKADEFFPQIKENQAETLAALLYLKSGVRIFLDERLTDSNIIPLQIPRLSFNNDQLTQISEVLNDIYANKDNVQGLKILNNPDWNDEAQFDWNIPDIEEYNFDCEPHVITTIEYVGVDTIEERKKIIKEVGYNTFLLPSKDITIDFLTDSGTTAQSVEQWSKYNEGGETQASSKDSFDFVETLQDVTGYKYIIPTHQGRAAEHIMSQCLIKDGYVPGNMYFTTTKLHQEMAGGTFVDVICDEAHDPQSTFIWKGNIDLKKVQAIIDEHGEGCIPYISFEFSVNLAGGQPISMDNAKEVYAFCKLHKIPQMFDATRAVENAYMIKKKDERYKDVSIKEILRELFSYGDGCTVSSKKDYLVNIGGYLAIRDDEEFYKKALNMLRIYEGSVTNGGISAADMAVHAQGTKEMVQYEYIRARVEQTQYLGEKLLDAGIPIVEPAGTHAIFLDAKRFLPHIDQDAYPAQALASALFVESGVRAMERGNVSSGRKKNGENYRPKLELVRLTIPRRAYTNSHMDMVAESIIALYKKRDSIKGLKFVYEPANLRFFQGRFEEI
ncbi:MAG: tryptophanase [Bacteroidota bacterium]|nr:tryptophanase [Bacteroidota bacterium]